MVLLFNCGGGGACRIVRAASCANSTGPGTRGNSYILVSLEEAPPAIFWVRRPTSSVFSSSSCFLRSSLLLPTSWLALTFPDDCSKQPLAGKRPGALYCRHRGASSPFWRVVDWAAVCRRRGGWVVVVGRRLKSKRRALAECEISTVGAPRLRKTPTARPPNPQHPARAKNGGDATHHVWNSSFTVHIPVSADLTTPSHPQILLRKHGLHRWRLGPAAPASPLPRNAGTKPRALCRDQSGSS